MNAFSYLITTPLGYILSFIYSGVKNYGFTIMIFTLVVKLLMLPLAVKQQKSMLEVQKLKPQLDAINKKYANDKERLNQETMKIYKENNVSPAGGCLPLLIQFPIIIGLYQVITRPMQYILHMDTALIQKVADVLLKAGKITKTVASQATKQQQIAVAQAMADNAALIQQKLSTVVHSINFDFFGLDLALTPSFKHFSLLWIIPILSAVSAYVSAQISMKLSGSSEQQAEQMKSMNIMMPLMSGYFCFIMPAGVGIYWIMSNVIQVIQQVIITKILIKKEKGEK